MYRTLLAIQNVCIDISAVIKESELPTSSHKKKKEPRDSPLQHLVTKPIRPSLTQVW